MKPLYRFRPHPLAQRGPVRLPRVRHNPGVTRSRSGFDRARLLVLAAALLWVVAIVVKMLAR